MQNLIAIIDDELDLLELLEYNLKKAGFDAIGFLNTNKIEQFLNEEDVDLLIVDRNLPGIEGSKEVEHLRKELDETKKYIQTLEREVWKIRMKF